MVLVNGDLCNYRVQDTAARRLMDACHLILAVNLESLFTFINRYLPLIK